METTNKLEKVLIEKEREFASDPEFVRLREFYEEMKRQGLAKKQEYSLPPLDTVGQRLYQAQLEAFRLMQTNES